MMWLNKLKHFPQSPVERLLNNLLRSVDFQKNGNRSKLNALIFS